VDALLLATYDSESLVVEQTATALGKIGAVQAVPRLSELQVVQGSSYVKVAANKALEKINELKY
jgi:HEAT repeat protein